MRKVKVILHGEILSFLLFYLIGATVCYCQQEDSRMGCNKQHLA